MRARHQIEPAIHPSLNKSYSDHQLAMIQTRQSDNNNNLLKQLQSETRLEM
jgi:hypothetical protein